MGSEDRREEMGLRVMVMVAGKRPKVAFNKADNHLNAIAVHSVQPACDSLRDRRDRAFWNTPLSACARHQTGLCACTRKDYPKSALQSSTDISQPYCMSCELLDRLLNCYPTTSCFRSLVQCYAPIVAYVSPQFGGR